MDTESFAAAVAAYAVAASIAIVMSSLSSRRPKYNVLTVANVDFDLMVDDCRYDQWFKDNLRCNHDSFASLCVIMRAQLKAYNLDRYMKRHSFEKKLATFLYFIGSQGGYREVAAVFGMSKSWCQDVVSVFSFAVCHMHKQWVFPPRSRDEWESIMNGFKSKRGLHGVVGAVDGTLIDIQRPKLFDGFYNRHGDPSLNIQAIVNDKGAFMSVDMRPGSSSDKKIWKMSSFGKSVGSIIPPGRFIIGDSGYTLFPWLLTPYLAHEEGGHLSVDQSRFNYVHSGTRMSVECAFGRLKERFRILKVRKCEKSLEKTLHIIMACFVLHNVLIHLQDELFITPDDERDRNSHTQPVRESDQTPTETTKQLRIVARYRRDRIARKL